MWRTHAVAEMTCDAGHFYVTAKLRAYKNGGLIFEREYTDSAARQLV